jgi:predicted acyltransferase
MNPTPTATARLESLDALRGFDMFWICGGGAVFELLAPLTNWSWAQAWAVQLEHVEWEGFRFEDLIFPLFVFMAGVSIPFAIPRSLETRGTGGTVRHILTRGAVLFALGIFQNGGIAQGLENMRLPGVLQRIGLAYTVSALLFCGLRLRGMVITGLLLLLGYWAMLELVPVPGFGAGDYARGHNLADYLDRYIPLHLYDGAQDPEGLLSSLTAVVSCLLGVFAGMWLRREGLPPGRRVIGLVLAGLVSLAIGWGWSLECPIIKKIWTPTFVLIAGGYSALLLAAFYTMIDVLGWRAWAKPFVWIGANSILVYLSVSIVRYNDQAERLMGGDIKEWLNSVHPVLGDFMQSVVAVLLLVLLCRVLYQRKVFLRV